MTGFVRRGVRLARSNPRVFVSRLAMLARHPVRNSRALISIAHRRERVEREYAEWLHCSIAHDTSPPPDTGPLLSVIMPVYDVDRDLLASAIESVVTQSYPLRELCIADDASTKPHVREVLEHY